MSSAARYALVLAVTSLGLVACTIASPTHITVQPTKSTDGTDPKATSSGGDAPTAAGEAAGGTAVTCAADDFTKPDLSKLTACGSGKGHCFDRDKTPMAEEMVACESGDAVCVPDEILTAGGDTLYACSVQALGGADGACITASLFPTIIAQGGDALKQDVCDPGQLCVPCKDPTHGNAPTPFCQKIGVHASACGNAQASAANDAGKAESELCCTTEGVSHGLCIDESAIPADQKSKTIRDSCKSATSKCVPKALVENNPVTCDSGVTGKGVCLDKCFNKWMSAAGSIGALGTAGCDAHEVCVPCVAAGSATPGCN